MVYNVLSQLAVDITFTQSVMEGVNFRSVAKASREKRIVPALKESNDWNEILNVPLPRSKMSIGIYSASTSLFDRSCVKISNMANDGKLWTHSLKWSELPFIENSLESAANVGDKVTKTIDGRTVSVETMVGGPTGKFVYNQVTLMSKGKEARPVKLCFSKDVSSSAAEVLKSFGQLVSLKRSIQQMDRSLIQEILSSAAYLALYGEESTPEEVEKLVDDSFVEILSIVQKACVMLDVVAPQETELRDMRIKASQNAGGGEAIKAPQDVIESLVFLYDRIKFSLEE
jgi:hypothetical protein